MHVCVTGVSGFIGSHLARRLFADGHFITGLVRPRSRRDHIAPFVSRLVVGDQSEPGCFAELVRGADCVIHNSVDWEPLRESGADAYDRHLFTNLVGSLRLLRASAPRQFIFVSTIAVHHDMRPRWAGLIDEDHPLRPNSPYGAYKAAVEAHLWAEHFASGRNTSAVRPCGVYGVEPRPERSLGADVLRAVGAGDPFVKKGGGKWVHVEDVAGAVAALVGNAGAAGRPFNLVDCYARYADWGMMAGEVLGVRAQVDASEPERARNEFSKEAARWLGVELSRGHEGIRAHLAELAGELGMG